MRRSLVIVCLGLLLLPSIVSAQDPGSADTVWAFRTRAIMTGVSDSSEPEGYKVYSAFSMEVDVTREVSRYLTLAWTLSTESREVELTLPGAGKVNLGSIELLPVNILAQFRPLREGRFHPYVGAGLNVTTFWEKSGSLDSTDLTLGIGPAVHVGFDYDISARMLFNLDFRAARLKTDLESNGDPVASLSIHPSTLGVGIGFRF